MVHYLIFTFFRCTYEVRELRLSNQAIGMQCYVDWLDVNVNFDSSGPLTIVQSLAVVLHPNLEWMSFVVLGPVITHGLKRAACTGCFACLADFASQADDV